MDQQILVPFDDSELGSLALDRALEEHPNAEITVIHVIDPNHSGYAVQGGTTQAVQESRAKIAEDMIAAAQEQADTYDETLTTVIEEGRSGPAVVEYAEENDIDHIIMGSHEQSEVAGILVGRIAETVIHNSPVPVTIAR